MTCTNYLDPQSENDVEFFSKEIHNAVKASVELGLTYLHQDLGYSQTPKFVKWEDLSEKAKEGKKLQAKTLLQSFNVKLHSCNCS